MVSFPKSVLMLALVSASLFAADFSKHSLANLQNLAGKVKPADALDYKIEIHKRIEQMTVKEARAFMQGMRENTRIAREKMTREEWERYQAAVREASRARVEQMTVKEARELGVLKKHYLDRDPDVYDVPRKQPKKQPKDGRREVYEPYAPRYYDYESYAPAPIEVPRKQPRLERENSRARIDSMSVKEAYERGLLKQYIEQRESDYDSRPHSREPR